MFCFDPFKKGYGLLLGFFIFEVFLLVQVDNEDEIKIKMWDFFAEGNARFDVKMFFLPLSPFSLSGHLKI